MLASMQRVHSRNQLAQQQVAEYYRALNNDMSLILEQFQRDLESFTEEMTDSVMDPPVVEKLNLKFEPLKNIKKDLEKKIFPVGLKKNESEESEESEEKSSQEEGSIQECFKEVVSYYDLIKSSFAEAQALRQLEVASSNNTPPSSPETSPTRRPSR